MKMTLEHINTSNAFGHPALSHAVRVGELVYVSGQVGVDPVTGAIPAVLEDEIRLMFDGLLAVLQSAGCALESVVKTSCYLKDLGDFGTFNTLYMEKFVEPRPARTTIRADLAMGLRVEIDAVAVVAQSAVDSSA